MKKKDNALWRAGENIVTSIAVTAAMLILRMVQMPGNNKYRNEKPGIFIFQSISFIYCGIDFFCKYY